MLALSYLCPLGADGGLFSREGALDPSRYSDVGGWGARRRGWRERRGLGGKVPPSSHNSCSEEPVIHDL